MWLAFGCFALSTLYAERKKEMEEICRKTQTISFTFSDNSSSFPSTRTSECWDSELNADIGGLQDRSTAFGIAGFGLILTFLFLPVLFLIRANQSAKNEFHSILSFETAKND
jgi:hypothetical protein